MSMIDRFRNLPLLGIVAALISAFVPVLAQAPDSGSDAVPQPAKIVTQPTPEQIGDSLMAHQRYQAAIEAYRKAPPDDATTWNKMGIAYQMMFNMTEAMRCYQKSLKLSPKNSNVLNNLGTAYDAQKDYRAAEKMYRKALKIDPNARTARIAAAIHIPVLSSRTSEPTFWRSTNMRKAGKPIKRH